MSIGYPAGLPVKLAAGASVLGNSAPNSFVTNTDAYGGNSGSPVFNASTGVVEGILARGRDEDFVARGSRWVSNRCSDSGECYGMEAARATELRHLVPSDSDGPEYEVHLGRCGELQPIGRTRETSFRVEGLASGERYCWKVIAKGECGDAESPVWSFSAGLGERFVRGDREGDGSLSGFHDALYLLIRDFRQLLPVSAPFPECGPGALASDASLGCQEPPAACRG